MNQQEIREEIKKLADPKYKEFHSRLCPNINNILGVRVPVLRKFSKELMKKINIEEYLETENEIYYEEIMLQGMILGNTNMDYNKKIKYIKGFVPKIDNWAICDTFCSSLRKDINKNKEEFWNILLYYAKSDKEFEIRFALVCMMNYYLEEKYIEDIFSVIENVKKDDYYVRMAIAWLLSIAYIKVKDETKKYLEENTLDDWTYNKALQKMIESYRISDEEKEVIRKMKR